MTLVLFRFSVIIDAHQQQVVRILSNLSRIIFAFNLVNGCVGIVVVFQLDDKGGGVYVFSWYEYQVSKTSPCGQLPIENLIVFGIIKSQTEYAG